MTDQGDTDEASAGSERVFRAEIVDRLYDVALDPIRLEELVDVWEGRLGRLDTRPGAGEPLEDPDIEAHVRRATVFLDRYEATRGAEARRSVLEQVPRSAAFLSDGGPQIAAFNRAAAVAFGLREEAPLLRHLAQEGRRLQAKYARKNREFGEDW